MGNGTSIGRVRGLGSAKHGAHHWLTQRFTAVGNLFLLIWLAVSILLLGDLSYISVEAWLSKPVPAIAMALLIISTFWHARLGVQVMMEDYVHDHGTKFACLVALNFAVFAGAAFGVLCVLRLALGA
ncbi:succinate dehydrogenase, hydrophobic membrane anchor protein [Novosphingobium profundi]|uniref:succinate dehydrogenase, hydrophobic membrane anchor protein n=1 Tax=Novosphingobium profundi TaxID=1774954 RepID=UPI001BDACA7D|nr:succinate dehydrogenase, hydrophobic membrane anchor protein [Novosphingobium profundi]MBT0668442.1 succinate dehydrogenase, hydrophobic membrane anchor protein [Novosphingobium profundi]